MILRKLRSLSSAAAGEWERVCRQCTEGLSRYGVQGWLTSFWGPSPKRLVLVPNPTDPPQCGFGPSTTGEAFCIVGPPAVVPEWVLGGDAPDQVLHVLQQGRATLQPAPPLPAPEAPKNQLPSGTKRLYQDVHRDP